MHIGVLGLNHRTTPVELREQMAFREEELPEALTAVRRELKIPECVILSTCNRVELYTLLPELNGHAARLREFLARFHQLDPAHLSDRFYWHLQPDSVRHLFRVAAGLESMVLGESEILGQVREAYAQAAACGSVGPVFHRLFQTAIRTGKEVRTKTRIGQGATSVSSVAVELARRIFRDFRSKTILTLGAGQMGEAALRSLQDQGVGSVLVANRTLAAAEPLALAFKGKAVPLTELEPALIQADIVISSTAADHYLLTRAQVHRIMTARRGRPIFLIDISVPRNLDPKIAELENVYLYDIDDLEEIASANRRRRLDEVTSCAAIVEDQLENFLTRISAAR
ncbi:MAG: glutamyl-tRNA reductase [Candidatus Omnitrophica bacterium]|nr:glutamyl-tRNA reductase [Candidatus Omnitrophota bacterium]